MVSPQRFGTYGVWLRESEWQPGVAAVAERLGYTTMWIGGSPSSRLVTPEHVLNETEHAVVATGIVNVWKDEATDVAASYTRILEECEPRLVIGIGSGHREATAERVRPLATLRAYLDVFDAEGVPRDARLLAALGDRTLALAAERSIGAHPYLTLPAHTAHARAVMGPGALLAPELKVSLSGDPVRARERARAYLESYFRLSNYRGKLTEFGAAEADFAGGGSDALIDQVAANPGAAEAVAGIRAHLGAGADHVAIQPVPGGDILGSLEKIADALGLTDGA
ncbi:TIGR03620 family F420-dependent LLM class oxidoreductase [Microbacterium indicum]|uniref:TIGR03620 family F420-dependent LLM class oxidoreductase n=1 Tax=Microbacterium indicum TaxID=358100 RepID=UPI0005610CD1|nr:TIGR03620 family F420-dependent LLM class oxidoreductase [Microbacterium indicum]